MIENLKERLFIQQKSKKRISIILLGLTVISLFLFTPIGQATANKMVNDYFDDPKNFDVAEKIRFQKAWNLGGKIVIFYDIRNQIILNTALGIYLALSQIYSNIELLAINTTEDLSFYFEDPDYFIKMYFFEGSLTGLTIGDDILSWNALVRLLAGDRSPTQHIFGTGNTLQLKDSIEKYNLNNVHIDESSVIDAQTSFVYYLYETSVIFSNNSDKIYQQAGKDIRDLTVIYFSENLNTIINAQAQPTLPLGEMDRETQSRLFNQTLEGWENMYQILPDGTKRYLNDTSTPVPDTAVLFFPENTNVLNIAKEDYYKIDPNVRGSLKAQNLVSQLSMAADSTDFTITDLPLFSGLEGPVAGIVDTLLNVLIKFGGKKLGINPNLAVEIANIVKEIGLFISDVAQGSGDVKTTIKSLITRIANVAPIPEKLKPWIPIIVDSIFLFKATPVEIVEFAKNVLVTVFNQTAGAFDNSTLKSIVTILQTVLLNTADLTVKILDEKQKAEEANKDFSVMNTIASFFFEKLLNFTSYEFIANIIGKFNSTVLQETSALMKLIIPLVKGFVFGDLGDVLAAIPSVAEYAINKLSKLNVSSSIKISFSEKQKSVFEGIGRFFDLAMKVFDKFSSCGGSLTLFTSGEISEGLTKLIQAILPFIDFTVGKNFKLSDLTSMVTDLLSAFADASRDMITDRSDLLSSIKTVFSKYKLPISGTASSLITEILTFIGQITISSMNKPSASDLRGIVDIVLNNVLGSSSTLITNSNNKPLSSQEITSLNAFNVSKKTKDIIMMAVDTIFGLLAMTNTGTSAQFLILDNFYELSEKATACKKESAYANLKPESVQLSTADLQKLLTNKTKTQIVSFVNIFIGNYIPANATEYVNLLSESLITILMLVLNGDGNSIMPTLQSMLMQGIGIFLTKTLNIDGTVVSRLIINIFTSLISGNGLKGVSDENLIAAAPEIKKLVNDKLTAKNASTTTKKLAGIGLDFVFGLKDLFTDGLKWIFQQFSSYIISAISDFLGKLLTKMKVAAEKSPLLNLGGSIPFAGADAIGIKFNFNLSLKLNLDIDLNGFVGWIYDMIFKGNNDLSRGIGFLFKKMFSFVNFSPIFRASLEVGTLDTGKPGLMTTLLEALPFDLTFTGKAWFELLFVSIKGGGLEKGSLLKVLEWGLAIVITISKDITVLDVVTGGAGGALNKVGKYIGLDSLKITLYFRITLEIFYQAAKADKEAVSKLTFMLTVGAKIFMGLNLAIVKIGLEIGLEVTLTFTQDLLSKSKPLLILLDLKVWAKVVLTFLFIDWEGKLEFRPPGFPIDISPKKDSGDLENLAYGSDDDHDGLSNDLEKENAELNPNSPDTDNDGLSDKFELRVSNTKPSNPDTDGDGVTDFSEYMIYKSDPLVKDTDGDGMSDYDEIYVYKTNAKSIDTDGDGLTDWYEINHEYNMTGLDPSVKFVIIGGEIFTNKTDPLNPDTDSDGLVDGIEDIFGPYYGDVANYYNDGDNNQTDGSGFKSEPDCYAQSNCKIDKILIYNGGYTSPLDNDTDGDSYFQLQDGSVYYDGLGNPRYIGDMSDGAEVSGITATVQKWDPVRATKIFVTKVFFTNPTNPDSDGDTGVCPSPWGLTIPCTRNGTAGNYLNGDGYELLYVHTDPLDADTDSDGLIDGLEGTLGKNRDFTTNPFNPDSDGDGLPDGLEYILGTNPNNPDTDSDQVLDGEEVYKYHTNPFISDSDFDGISDGWELFYSHSSPHSHDSDLDGLTDFQEIYTYGTNPVNEDSDNDGLTDQSEIFTYNTDPNNVDTDSDGLRDGEEVFTYFTDPSNPDTDSDGILWKDENNQPTFTWNDGQEVKAGTDPNAQDTDQDGITDSWEVYLATSDKIPIPNIKIDPLSNDTDNDGILDGQEMLVNESYSLIYPYVAYFVFYVFGSSPVKADTDSDGLTDLYEKNNSLNANSTDTDGDTLKDWDEIYIHHTDPRKDDTDGDGIPDNEEVTAAPDTITNSTLLRLHAKIFGFASSVKVNTPLYKTSAFNPDSDEDGWPDGLEINGTDKDPRYDPYNPDVNNNGVKDGYERDYDHDGISDGDEYYTYQGTGENDTGFLSFRNPDSDFDGLPDGDEILIYHTKPYDSDTDHDGYSDSVEIYFGTDPLVFTPENVFLDLVLKHNSPLVFINPKEASTIPNNDVSVEVVSLTSSKIENAWVQYREITDENRNTVVSDSEWSKNYTMSLSSGFFGLETPTWKSKTLHLDQDKEYEVIVYAKALNYSYPTTPDKILPSVILMNKVRFKIHNSDPFGLTPDFYTNIGLGVLVIVLASGGIALYLRRRKVVF